MRRNRGRPKRGGSLLLILTLAVLWSGGRNTAQQEAPSILVERAARAKTRPEREKWARKALRALALRDKEAPLLEARAWLLLEDPEQAARVLAGLPLPPPKGKEKETWEILRETARLLLEQRRWAPALSLLSRAAGKEGGAPAWASAWYVRAWTGAGKARPEKEFSRVLAQGLRALEGGWRKTPFLQAFFQALVLMDRKGRPDLAIRGFRALNRAFPRRAWPALNLAVALRHTGRYREAAEVLRQRSRVLPRDPALPTDEGLTWKCLGEMEKAEECFRRGLAAAEPLKTRDPRISLGLMLLDRGAKKEAEEVLRPTLMLSPPQPYAWLLWTRSAFCCGKRFF